MRGSFVVLSRVIAMSVFVATDSLAAGGHSPDWTQVADADLFLMGDYDGRWIDAPEKHYFDINPPLAAQVINVREGEYLIRFFQQHDARADIYFEGAGRLVDGVIRFEGNGWNGEVSKEGMSGRGSGHGGEARFETVTRAQPTAEQSAALRFANKVCKHVKSNAIVLARGTQVLGVGAGQMSRVDSARIASIKAGEAPPSTPPRAAAATCWATAGIAACSGSVADGATSTAIAWRCSLSSASSFVMQLVAWRRSSCSPAASAWPLRTRIVSSLFKLNEPPPPW